MDDKYDVFCIINNNIVNAEIRLYDEEKCKIELVIGDDILSAEADNYFYALINLRRITEPKGIKILCNGCSRYVYPSPMILDMGSAIKAYKLRLGEKAKMKDLVNIFEQCDISDYANIEEQQLYFEEWKNSKKI